MRSRTIGWITAFCLPALVSCGDTVLLQGDNPGVIRTVAGGGAETAVAGSRAIEVSLEEPTQVIALDGGDFYVLESQNHRLLYVDPTGRVDRIAGDIESGYTGDGGLARDARLTAPSGFDVGPGGGIYIADTHNNAIRRIDTEGIITTIAGTGTQGFSGDGGPAVEAQLFWPIDVTVDPLGRVFVSDEGNRRIRRIDTDGMIETVAGTGEYPYNGDGIPASQATIYFPAGLDSDASGNIYVAVSAQHRVRMIDTEGIIHTVAGNGVRGFDGDGGDAVAAALSYPRDVFVRPDGGLYIADRDNHRVRFVDPTGIIFTVAGTGDAGFNGDGLFATDAQLDSPSGVSLDIFNNLYVADTDNFRVRRVPFP